MLIWQQYLLITSKVLVFLFGGLETGKTILHRWDFLHLWQQWWQGGPTETVYILEEEKKGQFRLSIGAFWSNTGLFSLLSKTEVKIGEIRGEEGWRKVQQRSVKKRVRKEKRE